MACYQKGCNAVAKMKAGTPMALALIVVASLAATSCAGDKPSGSGVATPPEATAQASTTATQQPRNDRIVGYWTSSTGQEVTLAYWRGAPSFWIQVYPSPGRADRRLDLYANWISDDEFWFEDSDGHRVTGRVDPSDQTIDLTNSKGLGKTWTRNR